MKKNKPDSSSAKGGGAKIVWSKRVLNAVLSTVLVVGLMPSMSWADDVKATDEVSSSEPIVATLNAEPEVATEVAGEAATEATPLVAESVVEPMNVSGDTVTIGTGTSSNGAPYYYNYSGAQMIYTASEIGNAGTINAIAFNCATATSNKCSAFKVYMGHTSKASFSSASDYVAASDLTLVYDNSSYVLGSSTGWETIELQTPFEYDGTDNLVIAVYRQASTTCRAKYYYTSTTGGALLCGNARIAAYGTVDNTSGYKQYSYRPNLQLTIETCNHAAKTFHDAVAHTCTTDGTIAYYSCDSCGKYFDADSNKLNSIVDPAAHTYGEGVQTLAPTCGATGTMTYTCSVCDEATEGHVKTEVIPATGNHTIQAVAKVDPTCTEAGAEAHYQCSVCKKLFSDAEGATEISAPVAIPATGHNYTGAVTCNNDGTHSIACVNGCGTPKVVNCTMEDVSAVTEAGCTTEGVMSTKCSICNYVSTRAIPAKGHTYVDGVCSVCGAAEPLTSVTVECPAVDFGANATITAKATGTTAAVTYKLCYGSDKDGWTVFGQSSNGSFTLNANALNCGRTFKVTATSGSETVSSETFTIGVNPLAVTASCPAVDAGANATITAKATGTTAAVTYKLCYGSDKDGWTVFGQSSNGTFTLNANALNCGRTFKVTATSGSETVSSETFTIAVNPLAVTASCPAVDAGTTAAITAKATGTTAAVTYKLCYGSDEDGWTVFAKSTDGNFSIAANALNRGRTFKVTATSGSETVSSETFTIAVNPLAVTASCPAVAAGSTATITATATGTTAAVTYKLCYGSDKDGWTVFGQSSNGSFTLNANALNCGRTFKVTATSGSETVSSETFQIAVK